MNHLVLVNKNNKIPDNWDNLIDLEDTKNYLDESCKVEKESLKKYNELKKYLLENNILIDLDSSYRSVGEQQRIWNLFQEKYGKEYTEKYVAVPGYSEHHTGLAIDIILIKDGKVIDDNDELLKEIEIFQIIHKALPDYGFILRYPKGKEDITGYSYEPWHIRYIGNISIAKEIMNNNLTLEEYLKNKNKNID